MYNLTNKCILSTSFYLISYFSFSTLEAAGFRLTEQSLNGTALNSAFVAGAYGADSTYYNPANMSLGKENDKYEFELDGTLIVIPEFNFETQNRDQGINVNGTGIAGSLASGHYCGVNGQSVQTNKKPDPSFICGDKMVQGKATTTIQPIPRFFFKTRAYHLPLNLKTNFGMSFTTPSGLSMKWDGPGGGFLKDVSIAMLEFNPVMSVAWNDMLSFGVGFRALYTFGNFNNTLYVPFDQKIDMGFLGSIHSYGTTMVEQNSNARDWGFGYNLALSVKPFVHANSDFFRNTTLAVTYRSNVHWDMKGKLSAKSHIYQGTGLSKVEGYVTMDADLLLEADLPPILNIALSHDFGRYRAEFVYEYTFWSRAKIFDFGYSNHVFDTSNLTGSGAGFVKPDEMLGAADYSAVAYGNGWQNSQAYRLGLTYFGDTFKIMGSLAYDETPAPQGKFGIPDADGYMLGIGARKRFFGNRFDLGLAYSLTLKDNTKSFIISHNGLGQLHLITLGGKYLW